MRAIAFFVVGCMFAVLALPKIASAQGGCQVIVERHCSSIPGNISVFCSSTPCSGNTCPAGTKEGAATNNFYDEQMSEMDAITEGVTYSGPYDTFQCTQQVTCRVSALCFGCANNGVGLACASQFVPFLEFDSSGQPGVTDEIQKNGLIGSGSCD